MSKPEEMHKIAETDSYRRFVCAADKCPDTCCKSWDIAVDDAALEFYSSAGDEELVKNLTVDDDGDTVLRFQNGVCPFLSEGLCRIQTKYGGDKLCETCREFPRITQDYTVFEERLLTLACPEAARLMIIEDEPFEFLKDRHVITREDMEYDPFDMMFLIAARQMLSQIFRGGDPFEEKLRLAYDFTKSVQEKFDAPRLDLCSLTIYDLRPCRFIPDNDLIFELHSGMDVMDSAWLDEVESCRYEKTPSGLDGEMSRLMLYYIARYFLTAVASFDVITTITRAHCAAVVCGALIAHEKAENDPVKRALIYQKYSKEIEHSDENEEIFRQLSYNVMTVDW